MFSVSDEGRVAYANWLAAALVSALLATPWLLTESALPMDRELKLPLALLSALPERCERLTLYVGYPGCHTECPRALSLLAQVIAERAERAESAESAEELRSCELFLSLFPDQQAASERYAQSFHPQLKGLSLSPAELSPVLDQLGLSAQLSPSGAHRDLIYRLERAQPVRAWTLSSVSPSASLKARRP